MILNSIKINIHTCYPLLCTYLMCTLHVPYTYLVYKQWRPKKTILKSIRNIYTCYPLPCTYLIRTLYLIFDTYQSLVTGTNLGQTWDWDKSGTRTDWDKPGTRTDLRQNWDWDKPEIRNTWMGDNLMHKEPDLACTMETIWSKYELVLGWVTIWCTCLVADARVT